MIKKVSGKKRVAWQLKDVKVRSKKVILVIIRDLSSICCPEFKYNSNDEPNWALLNLILTSLMVGLFDQTAKVCL